jgi:cell division protein FtsB
MRLVAILLLVLLSALQYRLWHGHNGLRDYWRLDQQLTDARSHNDILRQRNALRHEEIRELKTGHDGIEERARNELGFIRDGETFYRVLETNNDANLQP